MSVDSIDTNRLTGTDFSQLWKPRLELNISAITERVATAAEAVEDLGDYNRRKDDALFETAEASKAQIPLLEKQLIEVQHQNQLLKENYFTLKELYEITKKESERATKEAKTSKVFGWVSFAIGTLVGITGIVFGIIL